MKKKILIAAVLMVPVSGWAQTAERQVLGSAGAGFNGAGIQADYTVGETVTASSTTGSFTITQGFQQNTAGTTMIKEQSLLVDFTLYPNPAQNQVTLSLSAAQAFDLKVSLINLAGQVLQADGAVQQVSSAYTRDISLQGLAAGVYFVNLYDGKNMLLKSIRFIKQ